MTNKITQRAIYQQILLRRIYTVLVIAQYYQLLQIASIASSSESRGEFRCMARRQGRVHRKRSTATLRMLRVPQATKHGAKSVRLFPREKIINIQTQMQDYQTWVQNYITQNYPNATVGDILGKKDVVQQDYAYLMGTLPYNKIAQGAMYSEIPDSLRHKISFVVEDDNGTSINYAAALPQIAGKKITLSYTPATPQDEATINSYLPKPHADGTPFQPSELTTSLPAYLINLKPELRIDGAIVATGTTIGMGKQEQFNMTFTDPGSSEIISNNVTAGEYYA